MQNYAEKTPSKNNGAEGEHKPVDYDNFMIQPSEMPNNGRDPMPISACNERVRQFQKWLKENTSRLRRVKNRVDTLEGRVKFLQFVVVLMMVVMIIIGWSVYRNNKMVLDLLNTEIQSANAQLNGLKQEGKTLEDQYSVLTMGVIEAKKLYPETTQRILPTFSEEVDESEDVEGRMPEKAVNNLTQDPTVENEVDSTVEVKATPTPVPTPTPTPEPANIIEEMSLNDEEIHYFSVLYEIDEPELLAAAMEKDLSDGWYEGCGMTKLEWLSKYRCGYQPGETILLPAFCPDWKPNLTDINYASGLGAEAFDKLIDTYFKDHGFSGTKMNGLGKALEEMEIKYNVNGLFCIAVGIHESWYGTSWMANNQNNMYGMIGMYFDSPYDCTVYWGKLIRNTYMDGSGLHTISAISSMYCGGNPNWISTVSFLFDDLGKECKTLGIA